MPKELASGKPTTRRYSNEEKAAAVRMVRTLRAELGVTQGTVQRVATQLGYGAELICRLQQVAPSSYYAAKTRTPSARAVPDEELIPQLVQL